MTAADVRIAFKTTTALSDAAVEAAVALLSRDERARFERFRFREDARDYAAAHALLRTELSRGTGVQPAEWQFDRSASGKPFLSTGGAGPRRAFSLSHARGVVACAIAPPEVAVGVDVESHDRVVDTARLAARFFAAEEIAALAALDPAAQRERFFDLWTLKEAVVKALGLTLPPALSSVTIRIDDPRGGRIDAAGAALPADAAWQLALFTPSDGVRIAVAAARRAGSPQLTISCSSA